MSKSNSTSTAIWQATTQQQTYRQLMQAFANPGQIETLFDDAMLLTLATLLDGATSLSDVNGLISALDWVRLETVNAIPELAHFVLGDGTQAPTFTPNIGTLESPEGGATILLTVAALDGGIACTVSGPGIDGSRGIAVQGLNPAWIVAREDWNAAFPMGVDILLLAGKQVMALPRTTRLTVTQLQGASPWVM